MEKSGKQTFAVILAITAILMGLFAIIKLVGVVELAVGVISLTFGVMAIIWTFKARSSLSKGSELRRYTTYFMLSLVAILMFSVWDTLLGFFGKITLEKFFLYPKFLFITVAYFVFLKAAYEILYISKSFGFESKAAEINQIIKSKKRLKKPR